MESPIRTYLDAGTLIPNSHVEAAKEADLTEGDRDPLLARSLQADDIRMRPSD
jgi:hypothetical protein